VASGEIRELRGHRHAVNDLAFSPDGTRLASVASDAKLKIWDTATGAEIYSTNAFLMQASGVAWSPDGKTIATLSDGEGCKLWHVATGREIVFWPRRDAGRTVTFSPDGHWLAIGLASEKAGGSPRLWLLPAPSR
jgi:WD40 repeat protein